MHKTLRVLAGAVAVAVLTAVPTSARPDGESRPASGRFTYVVGPQMYSGPVARVANGAGVAPFGHFTVVPTGSTLALTIDDWAAADGRDIYISVGQSHNRLFRGCVPVRTEMTITRAVPGEMVYVFLYGGYGGPCSAFATAGVVTVGGLE